MPSSVRELFAAAGAEPAGRVRWGEPVPESKPGVYAVALTDDLDYKAEAISECPLDRRRLAELLAVRTSLLMDGVHPTVDALAKRLCGFWLPDEVVLYIGLSKRPLRKRVREYYRTPLGARKPHAGGWWLKTLKDLERLWVHYAPTPGFEDAEDDMLRAFARRLSSRSRSALHDSTRVVPFANLRDADDLVKLHGIANATGEMP